MEKKIPTTFVGEIIGGLEKVTPEISKTRLSIFYKGFNRNQGYITDEFAKKLLSSLPYTPVVGIFNDLVKDFGGHDQDRNVAKIYGIVPQEPNVAWEERFDPDGVTRTYACTDVYLYTGRYDAAKLIPGKQQSMELDIDTIRGDWQTINGQEAYVYTDARFIGLSVLGNDKTPCFEGSAFFELVNKFNNFMAANTLNGGTDMVLEDTKIVASATEQPETEVEQVVGATPEGPEEVTQSEESTEAAVDNGDSIESESDAAEDTPDGDSEKEEPEKEENKDDDDGSAKEEEEDTPSDSETPKEEEEKEEEPSDAACNKKQDSQMTDSELTIENFEKLNSKILELNQKLATYETEANKYMNLYTALKADYDVLVAEKNKELAAQKDAKLQEYTTYISDAVKQDFESRLDSYSTVDELEKDLLFAAKPSLFAKHDDFAPTSTDEDSEDELAALIKKSMKH